MTRSATGGAAYDAVFEVVEARLDAEMLIESLRRIHATSARSGRNDLLARPHIQRGRGPPRRLREGSQDEGARRTGEPSASDRAVGRGGVAFTAGCERRWSALARDAIGLEVSSTSELGHCAIFRRRMIRAPG